MPTEFGNRASHAALAVATTVMAPWRQTETRRGGRRTNALPAAPLAGLELGSLATPRLLARPRRALSVSATARQVTGRGVR